MQREWNLHVILKVLKWIIPVNKYLIMYRILLIRLKKYSLYIQLITF